MSGLKWGLAGAIVAATAIMAADVPGFRLYRAAELQGYEKQLAPKMNAGKVASTKLDDFGNHLTMIAHREGDGEAEFHETQADMFVVVSGEATLLAGGKVVNPKTTAPHEIRGTAIEGGQRHKMTTGDTVHIPARVAHQLLVENGKQFTYFVIKVNSR
jgi:mannose-6-phosphate isomerase-like protein (cupin superfamily)